MAEGMVDDGKVDESLVPDDISAMLSDLTIEGSQQIIKSYITDLVTQNNQFKDVKEMANHGQEVFADFLSMEENLYATQEQLLQNSKQVKLLLRKTQKALHPDVFDRTSTEFARMDKRFRVKFGPKRSPYHIKQRALTLQSLKDKLKRDIKSFEATKLAVRTLAMEVDIRKTIASEDDDYLSEKDDDEAEMLRLLIERQEAQRLYEQKLRTIKQRQANKRRRIEVLLFFLCSNANLSLSLCRSLMRKCRMRPPMK